MPDVYVESETKDGRTRVRKVFMKWLMARGTEPFSPREQRDKLFKTLDWNPELSAKGNDEMLRLRTPGRWASDCFRIQKDSTIVETTKWIDFHRRLGASDERLLSSVELTALREEIERNVVAGIASLRDRIEQRFNSMWPHHHARPQDGRYVQLTSEIWVPINAELEDLEATARAREAAMQFGKDGCAGR